MNRGTPAPIHICFYSNRCEWSKAFLTEISQTPYHKEFKFVCVDPGANRPQLPSWLKQTPTLVISGEAEPRTDSEVMNWFYERKMMDGGGNRGANQGGGGAQGMADVGPEPYLDSEMGGGFGDSYSFIEDDTTTQGNGGMRMKHNFTYLNGQDAVGTREASSFQTTDSNQKKSKKEAMFDQQYEQMMKSRDMGIARPVARQ
jgi:hypothetical protein